MFLGQPGRQEECEEPARNGGFVDVLVDWRLFIIIMMTIVIIDETRGEK